jgi:demethoxyubiquinone hydroxylase (CLK1/Coq7/Cat5 family)
MLRRSLWRSLSRAGFFALLAFATVVGPATAQANTSSDEAAIQKLIADYGRAIETKDMVLFKAVKPNITSDEERRTRAGFQAVKSQTVRITVVSVEVAGEAAVVKVARRDTINGGLVSSFPQTLRLTRAAGGWGIVEIGK